MDHYLGIVETPSSNPLFSVLWNRVPVGHSVPFQVGKLWMWLSDLPMTLTQGFHVGKYFEQFCYVMED